MKEHFNSPTDRDALRAKIIGLGDPELERRLAELERFRALLDQSNDLFFLAQVPSGRCADMNESACRQLGYSREALLAMSVSDLVPESVWERMVALFADEGRVGQDGKTIVTAFKCDGGEVPVEMSVRLVAFSDAVYAVIVARDITGRVRAEEERDRGHRLLLALNQAAQAVQRARTPEAVYHAIGEQAVRLGFDATVLTLNDDRTHLILSHLTLKSDLVRAAEKLTGLSAEGYRFPLTSGGSFQRIIAGGEAVFSHLDTTLFAEALPRPVRPLAGRLADLAGWQQNIIAPLTIGGEVQGLLVVTGTDLTESDVPAITAFANQAATAIENARLYKETQHLVAFNESIIQSMAEGIAVVDADEVLTFVNPAAAEMLGYTPNELVGLHWTAIIPPDQQPIVRAADERRMRGEADRYELKLVRKDGGRITALVSGTPRFDTEGHFAGTMAVFTDITERKRAEEVLRQSNEFLESVLQNTPSSIFVRDLKGRYLLVNRQYQQVIGLTSEQAIGKRPEDLHRPQAAAQITRNDHLVLESGVPFESEETVLVDDEPHTFIVTKVPLRDAAGQPNALCTVATDITERKRAEEALGESHERLLTILDSIDADIYVADMETYEILFMNQHMRASFGEDLVGEICWKVFRSESGPCTHCTNDQLLDADGNPTGVVIWEGQNPITGSWYLNHDRATKWVDGRLVRLQVATDISEHKRAEEALRASERRYRNIIQSIPMGMHMYQLEPDGRLVFTGANRAADEILGVSNDQFIGQTIEEAFPPLAKTEVPERYRLAASTGEPWHTEQITYQDDQIAGAFDVYAFQTSPGRMTAAFWEITERKRVEEARVRLATAIEQSAESVVVADTEGTILYVNPAFEQVTGYSRAEAIGQNPRILKSGRQDAAFYEDLWTTLRAGRVWHGRFVNRRKDGMLYTEDATISPVRDENDSVVSYVAVKRDVTGELDLEERYRQSQKMEAIGRLAGGVAHDFNNLLTAIQGYASLLREGFAADSSQEWPSGPTIRADLGEILKAAERANSLTQQLLAFSRKQVLQPRVLNLNEVLAGVGNMLRRLIGEDIELHSILDPALGHIRADPGQIEQVILNLSVNARDAMPRGGRLTFETANTVLDRVYARMHPGVEPGAYVRLVVSDTGMGMTEEVKAHLFEPFFTTKEESKGTGLGLATVWGIIDQSGGHVGVYSELGVGTTFKVYLPRVDEMHREGTQRGPARALPRGVETILLAEDEEMVRRLAHRVLEKCGYTVLDVGRPEDALLVSEEHADPIHLLVTDVVMPGIGGRELAERLAPSRPGMKVLYISGYTDDAIVRHGVLEPGVAFLQKPFAPAALARKVREVLDGSPAEQE